MVQTALVVLAATIATADAGQCACSCCNWCHMPECYDGVHCCGSGLTPGGACSTCDSLEEETPAWVKEARAAAHLQAAKCSLYEIADGMCSEAEHNCDFVKFAKVAEKGLQDGKCADHGYTVEAGTQNKSYPVIGDIAITTYSKASLRAAAEVEAEAEVTGNDCYCSCCSWCHMANCYDGIHCCGSGPDACSTCGTLEDEVDTPEWVLAARASAIKQATV